MFYLHSYSDIKVKGWTSLWRSVFEHTFRPLLYVYGGVFLNVLSGRCYMSNFVTFSLKFLRNLDYYFATVTYGNLIIVKITEKLW